MVSNEDGVFDRCEVMNRKSEREFLNQREERGGRREEEKKRRSVFSRFVYYYYFLELSSFLTLINLVRFPAFGLCSIISSVQFDF